MPNEPTAEDPAKLPQLPVTYQGLTEYFGKLVQASPFLLRKEAFLRIERITGRPLICYVTKTHHLPQGLPAYIDDSDLTGFSDVIHPIEGDNIDVFLISNGGSAEAAERIVRLLRGRFGSIHFINPGERLQRRYARLFFWRPDPDGLRRHPRPDRPPDQRCAGPRYPAGL